jgi:hypothetical protein
MVSTFRGWWGGSFLGRAEFSAHDSTFKWGAKTEFDFPLAHTDDDHFNVVVDPHRFIWFATEYQHVLPSFGG